MSNYALVVLLPQKTDTPTVADFAHREFSEWDELPELLRDLDERSAWQAITIVHIEDLPKLMEGPG